MPETPPLSLPPPAMTAGELDDFLAGAFPGVGRPYRTAAVTDVGVRLVQPVGPEHGRPGGSVSGPTMMGLADAAAWLATLSRIGPVAMAVTSSLTIHFLRRPSLDQELVAEAELLRLGRRLSVSDVRITSGAGGPVVAHASVTYAIPSGTARAAGCGEPGEPPAGGRLGG